MNVRDSRRGRLGLGVLTPVALLASSALVYHASSAAFTSTTQNGTNTWSSGSVVLADDDSGNVMFSPTGLVPGSTGTKCINVTYTGNAAAAVKLYVNPYNDSGLGQYLNFTIEQGTGATGGSSGDCSGFTGGTSLYSNGTLDGVSTTNTGYANGLAAWSPTGSGSETRSYRFTYTLQDNDAAQNKSTAATFVWEARNT